MHPKTGMHWQAENSLIILIFACVDLGSVFVFISSVWMFSHTERMTEFYHRVCCRCKQVARESPGGTLRPPRAPDAPENNAVVNFLNNYLYFGWPPRWRYFLSLLNGFIKKAWNSWKQKEAIKSAKQSIICWNDKTCQKDPPQEKKMLYSNN